MAYHRLYAILLSTNCLAFEHSSSLVRTISSHIRLSYLYNHGSFWDRGKCGPTLFLHMFSNLILSFRDSLLSYAISISFTRYWLIGIELYMVASNSDMPVLAMFSNNL